MTLPALTAELCLSAGAFEFEASDSFNRADNAGSMGYADSRQPWVVHAGTAGISGNKAYFSAITAFAFNAATVRSIANGDLQVTMSTMANGSGIAFRMVDGESGFLANFATGFGLVKLYRYDNGVSTTLGSAAASVVDGTVLKVRAEGSTITVYVDGVAKITVTDSTYVTAQNAGIYAESTAARFDTFSSSFVWTDITPYLCGVLGTVGASIQRGRQHELSQMETGTCDVVLQNDNRRFDPLYTLSDYYPNLLPLRRIRLAATWESVSYPLFVGHIERWPLDYNMPATDGTVKVTAVDRLAVIGSGLWDAYPDTVLGMDPDAYWRMGAA